MWDENIEATHAEIVALQAKMCKDKTFRHLCVSHGLPWDFESGYFPRWYGGPAPSAARVLLFMAEPAPIAASENVDLTKAVSGPNWPDTRDLTLPEHYWRKNVMELCRHIWPTRTVSNLNAYLGRSCTFWMSMPHGSTTKEVPAAPLDYFIETYLTQLLSFFSRAEIVAAGRKASRRLDKIGVRHHFCWAFTRPGCNHPNAAESWRSVGSTVAAKLSQRL
jgi:hypothetical protein